MSAGDKSDRLERERRRRAKAAQVSSKAVRPPRLEPWRPKRPGEEIEIAFMPGLTINEDQAIAKMQKQTHDGLIEMLGRRRRSGIRWGHVHGSAECHRVLREMYEDDVEKWPLIQEHYFPFIAEFPDTCVMVVAECEAVR